MSSRKLTTYILFYRDRDGESDGFEAYGYHDLMQKLKWLRSAEVSAVGIQIYKRGKNFENDQDDILEVYRKYWK